LTARSRRSRPARTATPKRKPEVSSQPAPKPELGAEVARLSALLAGEREPARGLEHLLSACRRLTQAEAGTVYLRRGETLDFAVVQNDVLAERLGADEILRRLAARPLSLRETSIASYVVLTRASVNLRDAYEIPADQSCTHFRALDRKIDYRTRSMLATPLRDAQGRVFGVLQLINALEGKGRVGAFSKDHQAVVQTLAALAAHIPAAAATS
jgi:GAF domain-containing protein